MRLVCHHLPYHVSFKQPLRTAGQTWHTREGWWIALRDRSGLSGLGEVTPLPPWGSESFSQCQEALNTLASRTFDLPAWPGFTNVDEWSKACQQVFGIQAGVSPALWAGLELALLDYCAKAEGVPLYRLLGAVQPAPVTMNALLAGNTPDELSTVARAYAKDGFKCFKLKVGYLSNEEDVARVASLRQVLGPCARLRLDANGTWSRPDAIANLKRFAPYDIAYVEQPVAATDFEGLRIVQEASGVPVAADEALGAGADAPQRLIQAGVTALVLKPGVHGGLLRALAIVRACQANHTTVVMTSALDRGIASLGILHALSTTEHPAPCGLGTTAWLNDTWPNPPLTAQGPVLTPTKGYGLGVNHLPADLATWRPEAATC